MAYLNLKNKKTAKSCSVNPRKSFDENYVVMLEKRIENYSVWNFIHYFSNKEMKIRWTADTPSRAATFQIII